MLSKLSDDLIMSNVIGFSVMILWGYNDKTDTVVIIIYETQHCMMYIIIITWPYVDVLSI